MDRLAKMLLSTFGFWLLWSSATPSLTADTASMTLSGHAERVWSVANSPDGKTLASGGGDKVGEIKLWDLATGKPRPVSFIGHTAAVSFVVFSPDGKTLASGSNDQTIRLWEAATGKAKGSFPAALVTSLAFSPDGKTLASGCYDWTVQLWDVATGREKASLQARTPKVHTATAVAYSPDGKTLAWSGYHRIKLWDVVTGMERATLGAGTDETEVIAALAFSPDSKTLASTSTRARALKFWDVLTGKAQASLQTASAPVSLAYSPDGGSLVSSGQIGAKASAVRLWDLATGKEIATYVGHLEMVRSVAFCPDGKTVASGSYDRSIKIWEVSDVLANRVRRKSQEPTVQAVRKAQGTTDSTAPPVPSPSPSNKLSVAFDRIDPPRPQEGKAVTIYLKEISNERHGALVFQYRVDAVGEWKTAAQGRFSLNNLKAGQHQLEARVLEGKTTSAVADTHLVVMKAVVSPKVTPAKTGELNPKDAQTDMRIALSSDGKFLATTTNSRTTLWDVAGGKMIQQFKGHTGIVQCVAVSGDGKLVLTGSYDKTAILWDGSSGQKLHTLRGHDDGIMCVALSGDGKLAATGSHDHNAILWQTATGKRLQTFPGHNLNVTGVALSNDGKKLFTAEGNQAKHGRAIAWQVSGKKLGTFEGHMDYVPCLALSEDGKRLVTGSYDKVAILWLTTTGKKLQTFSGHSGQVNFVALTADGKQVLSGNYELYLWEAASGTKLQTFRDNSRFGTSGVALSGDGKYVWMASAGGTALFDPATGKERCRLLTWDDAKGWLVVTPTGYFDGSPDAWRVVVNRMRGTETVVDDDATRRRLNRPGLLAQIWKGEL